MFVMMSVERENAAGVAARFAAAAKERGKVECVVSLGDVDAPVEPFGADGDGIDMVVADTMAEHGRASVPSPTRGSSERIRDVVSGWCRDSHQRTSASGRVVLKHGQVPAGEGVGDGFDVLDDRRGLGLAREDDDTARWHILPTYPSARVLHKSGLTRSDIGSFGG